MERTLMLSKMMVALAAIVANRCANGKIAFVDDAKVVVSGRDHHPESVLCGGKVKVWMNNADAPLSFYHLGKNRTLNVEELTHNDLRHILHAMETELLDRTLYEDLVNKSED